MTTAEEVVPAFDTTSRVALIYSPFPAIVSVSVTVRFAVRSPPDKAKVVVFLRFFIHYDSVKQKGEYFTDNILHPSFYSLVSALMNVDMSSLLTTSLGLTSTEPITHWTCPRM